MSSPERDPETTTESPAASQQENSAEPKPSQEEVVSQLQETAQQDAGPNETLRHNIELYSRYTPVFASVAYTVISAILIPAILAFVVVQLSPAYDLSELKGSVQRGLSSIVLPLFVSLMLGRAMIPQGLARRQLGWSAELCNALKATLDSIIYFVLPLRFLYVALETFSNGEFNDSLGRIVFTTAMAGFTVGLTITSLRLKRWLSEDGTDRPWHGPIQKALLYCLPLMPFSLAVMAVTGFYFTAEELSSRAIWTVLSMVGIALIGGLCSRLLLIAQFIIKLRELSRDTEGQIESDESIDIASISAQVNRLIRATAFVAMVLVGWQIWNNVLPAIGYLDSVKLPWQSAVEGPAGMAEFITLRHALIAIGVGILTFILSRNLPGLLEITLLDRLPLDRGGRYAISFVVRYLVAIIGLIAAGQLIGFSWNRVQWLAAGLTVGLGFGLQEIFANLVSGIIILIERPVRVGDTVTVDGTTGVVSKMALRATTILDFDYCELIVPNKKFITENVLNWTLSDNRTRIIVKVGVAYGSDTQLVTQTLLKVAQRHPLVMRDPEPVVVFSAFGDSTLNFDLRVVIPSRDLFLKMRHEMHLAVDEAFRQKGIEIAFPQQDITIKNLGDLTKFTGGGSDNSPGSPGKAPSSPATGRGGPAKRAGASAEAEDEIGDSIPDEEQDNRERRVA